MKRFLFAAAVLFSAHLSGQIVFEEVPAPDDFSMEAVRKSPTGEYFVQASNDYGGIYHSPDGQVWTRTSFPVNRMVLDEIQFYTDGTPVLKSERDLHLIRRDGAWHTLPIPGRDEAEASFIKQDTLFAYNRERFAYSVDKGASFTELFTDDEYITDHTAHLWVSDAYIILHHTAGASDYVSIYNRQGQRVLFREAALSPRGFLYSTCGEILLYDWDVYFMVRLSPLEVIVGDMEDIYPGFHYDMRIHTQGDHYYLADEQSIFRTIGCAFDWELLATSPLIDSLEYFYVDPSDGILLNAYRANSFVERPAGSQEWQEKDIEIHYPFVLRANESNQGQQAARTPNALFYKDVLGSEWVAGSFLPEEDGEVHYTPDGTLYLAGEAAIYTSINNGQSFDTIPLPGFSIPGSGYALHLLDDHVLFVVTSLLGECFYSLDSGQEWVQAPISHLASEFYRVRLVGNTILMAAWDWNMDLFRINLPSNEAMWEGLGTAGPLGYVDVEIMEDGTVYYLQFDIFGQGQDGLHRYQFGGSSEYLGYADEMASISRLASSSNVLFAFGTQSGYRFDGDNLTDLEYSGLPQAGIPRFFLAANQHAYAIVGNNRIFRSREPVAYAQNMIGRVVWDEAQDCIPDTLDGGLRDWMVVAEGAQFINIRRTKEDGAYQFNLPEGTYTVTAIPVGLHWGLCSASYPVTIAADEQAVVPDFHGIGLSTCATLDIDFSTPLLRRCFDNSYYIRVRNTGPGASAATELRLELDPFFDFISATHPYTMDGESILLFDLGVLEVNAEVLIQVVFNLSCEADLGMTHCLSGQLLDDNLCGNERSTYTECQENIGSYDPNDKRTFNAAGRETQTVDKDEHIYYHIRFQNTGTDTAFRVRILDTLSARLDPRTLEMLSASHLFTYAVNDGPTLEVIFDDIFLPDSNVNESASHGFFKFRIKPYPQYDYGTKIPNDASIYFDYNDPVITPEALLVLQQAVSTSEPAPTLSFDLTPNPASDWIVVRPDPDGPVQPDGYRIMDRLGRVVAASVLAGDLRVDVSRLSPGVYHFALLRDGVMIGGRAFVKM